MIYHQYPIYHNFLMILVSGNVQIYFWRTLHFSCILECFEDKHPHPLPKISQKYPCTITEIIQTTQKLNSSPRWHMNDKGHSFLREVIFFCNAPHQLEHLSYQQSNVCWRLLNQIKKIFQDNTINVDTKTFLETKLQFIVVSHGWLQGQGEREGCKEYKGLQRVEVHQCVS